MTLRASVWERALALRTNCSLQVSVWIIAELELHGRVCPGKTPSGAAQLPTAFPPLGGGACFVRERKWTIYFIAGGFKNVAPLLTCRSFLKSFLSTEPEHSENTLFGDKGPEREWSGTGCHTWPSPARPADDVAITF